MDLELAKLEKQLRDATDAMELARVRWLRASKAVFDYQVAKLGERFDAFKETSKS